MTKGRLIFINIMFVFILLNACVLFASQTALGYIFGLLVIVVSYMLTRSAWKSWFLNNKGDNGG